MFAVLLLPAPAAKVRSAVREENTGVHAAVFPHDEIGLRLYSIPAFRTFAEHIGSQILAELTSSGN